MSFRIRLRRLRQNDWIRDLVAENQLTPSDLVWPVFVQEGKNTSTPIPSLPGVCRHSIDQLLPLVREAAARGIRAIALFPVVEPDKKTENAEEAYNESNLICRCIEEIRASGVNIGLVADVALDPYTIHGHDGLMRDGIVSNDETVDVLIKQSIAQARAGCDVIAPSDMMDGRIERIRDALDKEGYENTILLSYAAKYASSYYGPFRDAVGSKSSLGKADKRTYQMDFRNSAEALREVALDIEEGADMIMVKPGLPYLDIIRLVKDRFGLPTFAYQVSGEYAMQQAAIEKGWLDQSVVFESLMAIKRAGADGILTYSAFDIADLLA